MISLTKKLALSLIFILFSTATCYGYLFWKNNITANISDTEVRQSYIDAKRWLLENEGLILNENNAMLWRMVKHSADINYDLELRELFNKYKARHLDRQNSLWRPLFEPKASVRVNYEQITHFPDYNQFFIYAISCDARIKQHKTVSQQLEANFCAKNHPISPACSTHQLMSVRMLQARNCDDPVQLAKLSEQLQRDIAKQLKWDVRVVDVYLQRVLMLTDSGNREAINPRWLTQILKAQRVNGGWGDFDPLITLGEERAIGFGAKGFKLANQQQSSFHATAQGLLLTSLWLNPNPHIKYSF